MIYCIWYPSGGFGHFVNAILSLHGDNFVRPKNTLEFSKNGNSHSLDLIAPKYFHDNEYNFNFLDSVNYSVLIDNGINSEGEKFVKQFFGAKIIKLCYTDYSWPVVARTMIEKAMGSTLDSQLSLSNWDVDEDWAKREQYFLFLRDHELRHKWQGSSFSKNINVEQLLDYNQLKLILDSEVKLSSFKKIWDEWFANNFQYFMPVQIAQTIINQVKENQSVDLSTITDIWTQAVVYYYIWLEFNKEVPHNDYKNWFDNTSQICAWLRESDRL
jgi:hypothetical protein